MKKVTVIIPIDKLNSDKDVELFDAALKSIPNACDIIVVGNEDVLKNVKSKKCVKVINEFSDNYQTQINIAVQKVETEYFSVLEYDDVLSDIWLSSFTEYSKCEPDVFGFLPLTEIVDYGTNNVIGYANEAFWASSFSENIGYLDLSSIMDYLNFNTSGGIFKTKEFVELGMLKPSMKLVFWYEFLMRALNKGKLIYVIPKIGYYHKVNRPDSFLVSLYDEMNSDETDWWIELAKKEYFFNNDRNKTYEK